MSPLCFISRYFFIFPLIYSLIFLLLKITVFNFHIFVIFQISPGIDSRFISLWSKGILDSMEICFVANIWSRLGNVPFHVHFRKVHLFFQLDNFNCIFPLIFRISLACFLCLWQTKCEQHYNVSMDISSTNINFLLPSLILGINIH